MSDTKYISGQDDQTVADFSDHYCNECGCADTQYHMLGSPMSVDYCSPCYEKCWSKLCRPNDDLGPCDVCYRNMYPGLGYLFGNGGACCEGCQPLLHSIFVSHINNHIIRTSKNYLFLFNTNVIIDVPAELSYRLLPPEDFYRNIDNIVRPPAANSNLAEWRMFTSYDYIPLFKAACAWAVRCVNLLPDTANGKYEIASMVSNHDDQVAMNIIKLNLTECLAAEKEWINNRPNQERRREYFKQAKEAYAKNMPYRELLAEATDSFAIYYRLKNGMRFYE